MLDCLKSYKDREREREREREEEREKNGEWGKRENFLNAHIDFTV